MRQRSGKQTEGGREGGREEGKEEHVPFKQVVSWNRRVSMAAAKRLFAAVMAWMSPVKCRLNSSMGTT